MPKTSKGRCCSIRPQPLVYFKRGNVSYLLAAIGYLCARFGNSWLIKDENYTVDNVVWPTLAVAYVVTAWYYLLCLEGEREPPHRWEVWSEWCNLFSCTGFLVTALLYPWADESDAWTTAVAAIELGLTCTGCAGAVLHLRMFYFEHAKERNQRGLCAPYAWRDPEWWANLFFVVPEVLYVVAETIGILHNFVPNQQPPSGDRVPRAERLKWKAEVERARENRARCMAEGGGSGFSDADSATRATDGRLLGGVAVTAAAAAGAGRWAPLVGAAATGALLNARQTMLSVSRLLTSMRLRGARLVRAAPSVAHDGSGAASTHLDASPAAAVHPRELRANRARLRLYCDEKYPIPRPPWRSGAGGSSLSGGGTGSGASSDYADDSGSGSSSGVIDSGEPTESQADRNENWGHTRSMLITADVLFVFDALLFMWCWWVEKREESDDSDTDAAEGSGAKSTDPQKRGFTDSDSDGNADEGDGEGDSEGDEAPRYQYHVVDDLLTACCRCCVRSTTGERSEDLEVQLLAPA